jgi:hypothetical protein
LLRNCKIDIKNSRLSKSSNIYELIFTDESSLEVVENEYFKDLKPHYNLTSIGDIIKLPENHFVDMLGVVKSVGSKKCLKDKEFCELVLIDDSEFSIVCTLWNEVCSKISNEVKRGTIVLIKAGKTSYKIHGRSVMVGNYSEIKFNPNDIQEAKILDEWYKKKNFKNLKNVAYNKCLLLDGNTVTIDDVLDHIYETGIPLIRNVLSTIISIKEGAIYCCPETSCDNAPVELQAKNRYICKNCRNHVSPINVAKIEVQIGDAERSLRATCYGEMAENLMKHYKNGKDLFTFRIYGILKNTGVSNLIFTINYCLSLSIFLIKKRY